MDQILSMSGRLHVPLISNGLASDTLGTKEISKDTRRIKVRNVREDLSVVSIKLNKNEGLFLGVVLLNSVLLK